MNKHLHRVIFNAARGQRVAVHEAASSNSGRGRLAAGDITLMAQDLVNTTGEVAASGQLDVAVAGRVDNTRGSLLANQNLSLAASTLDNTGGSVGSRRRMRTFRRESTGRKQRRQGR